jgi:hypothetical protein
VTATRTALITVTVTCAVAGLFLLLWHPWSRSTSRSTTSTPSSASNTSPASGTTSAAAGDTAPTTIYAHNLMLRKGPNFRVYIRWIRGQMVRTHPKIVPSFDDADSFVLEIQKGVIHANIGDIGNFLNTSSTAQAPLKNISVQPQGDQLQIHGTLHKIIPLPIELVGTLSPTGNGLVRFHVTKLDVLKIPMKGLLGGLHIQLSDLVHSTNVPGIQISDSDIIFDTQKLLPAPHIRGQLTSIRVTPPDLEVIYGNAPNDQAKLAQWHNFLKLTGGSLDFGKLTMRNVDLTMIDASQDPWFDLDLVNYQAQLVNGYSRMTPQAGLEIFMPDVDEKASKNASQNITLEWLKNRNLSLPPDVPVK